MHNIRNMVILLRITVIIKINIYSKSLNKIIQSGFTNSEFWVLMKVEISKMKNLGNG
jgi:hypothetical protein